ncbi:hypothetical protein FPV67DRAFT_1485720 [Lyophyllum atratum]|nr:hypothetical protein FPV67DRAFT_1485720 [Lyophyllum atratum]
MIPPLSSRRAARIACFVVASIDLIASFAFATMAARAELVTDGLALSLLMSSRTWRWRVASRALVRGSMSADLMKGTWFSVLPRSAASL